MVQARNRKEAEAHATEDKQNKEAIETRNNADSLVYQAEKTIKDVGDKADKALIEKVEQAISKLKETLKGTDAEKIKADTEELTKPLYELSQVLYNQTKEQEASESSAPKDETIVDAEVVDDKKNEKA